MDLVIIKKSEDGRHYIGYYLDKPVTKQSTLQKALEKLAKFVKGQS